MQLSVTICILYMFQKCNSVQIDAASNDPYIVVNLTDHPRGLNIETADNYWQIQSVDDNETYDWGLSMTLDSREYSFQSGQTSKLTITMNGSRGTTQCDAFYAFSVGNEYITFTNDFDGGLHVIGGSDKGIFIYPSCGANSFETGDASQLLSQSTYTSFWDALRKGLVDGNATNWERMTSERVQNGNTFPVTFKFINDDVAGTFTFRFTSSTVDVQCVYNTIFPIGEDFKFYLSPDGNDPDEVIIVESFDISGDNIGIVTSDPTNHPTIDPTADPTSDPTSDPTEGPTTDPTEYPTVDPTADPTKTPTSDPTTAPTSNPTNDPTSDPTSDPTKGPTIDPTEGPTIDPTADPTSDPTLDPTSDPTADPTSDPTTDPTAVPTKDPSIDPTSDPTSDPTANPTTDPTSDPTSDPTADPTTDPISDPTSDPTLDPTSDPTADPTTDPTIDPTEDPTTDPTADPTSDPTTEPTAEPTFEPTTSSPTTSNPTIHAICDCYQTELLSVTTDEDDGECYLYKVSLCDDEPDSVFLKRDSAFDSCGADITSLITSWEPEDLSFFVRSEGPQGIQVNGLSHGDIFRFCFDASQVSGTSDAGFINYYKDIQKYSCPVSDTLFDLCGGEAAQISGGFQEDFKFGDNNEDMNKVYHDESLNVRTIIWSAAICIILSFMTVFISHLICINYKATKTHVYNEVYMDTDYSSS